MVGGMYSRYRVVSTLESLESVVLYDGYDTAIAWRCAATAESARARYRVLWLGTQGRVSLWPLIGVFYVKSLLLFPV